MWPLILLCSCLVLPGYGDMVGPKEVSGFEGDTVSLQCTYGQDLQQYAKYWCRDIGILLSRCSDLIYAREDGRSNTEGRVSIQDDPYERKIKVTLSELTLQDTGSYLCGASRLGFDKVSKVKLIVFPGPCCSPTPAPFFQPPTTRSLRPKAKAWQTQAPELRTTRLLTEMDPTSAEDTSRVPSSSSSKSRVAIPMVRILAPVLVLLSLLLTAGLIAFSRCVLRWRKEDQLAEGTQENEKVEPSHLALGNSWVPEYAVINLPRPTEPGTSPKPSPCPYTEIRHLNQISKEDEALSQDPEGDTSLEPPLQLSSEQLGFIPV